MRQQHSLLLENRSGLGLRVAKRIEKNDDGFLDTPFASLRVTRKPFYLGLRVAKRIEKTD
jgi:hypothetical protein